MHIRGTQHPRRPRPPFILDHPPSRASNARQHPPRQVQIYASPTQQLKRRSHPPRTRINLCRRAQRRPGRQHNLRITQRRVPARREDKRTAQHVRRLNRLPLYEVQVRVLGDPLDIIQQRRTLTRRIPERHLTRREHLHGLTRPIKRHLKLSHRHRNRQPNSLQPLLRRHKTITKSISRPASQKHRVKLREKPCLILGCLTQQHHPL